jgi:hypothetical protein
LLSTILVRLAEIATRQNAADEKRKGDAQRLREVAVVA